MDTCGNSKSIHCQAKTRPPSTAGRIDLRRKSQQNKKGTTVMLIFISEAIENQNTAIQLVQLKLFSFPHIHFVAQHKWFDQSLFVLNWLTTFFFVVQCKYLYTHFYVIVVLFSVNGWIDVDNGRPPTPEAQECRWFECGNDVNTNGNCRFSSPLPSVETLSPDKIITRVCLALVSLALGKMCSVAELHKIHLVSDTAAWIVTIHHAAHAVSHII